MTAQRSLFYKRQVGGDRFSASLAVKPSACWLALAFQRLRRSLSAFIRIVCDSLGQPIQRYTQAMGDTDKRGDGERIAPALNAADRLPVDANQLCQTLLRHLYTQPRNRDVAANDLQDFAIQHIN